MCDKVSRILKEIFLKCVSSVQIPSLIRNNINYDKTTEVLKVYNFPHNLANKDVYLVGAGKAVFQMAIEIERILNCKLKHGIISIPKGVLNKSCVSSSSVIEFYEGAENNLPDAKAEYTTNKIINLVKNLDEKSVLLVLLSGGGSALLPAPLHPITLQEKGDFIKKLANTGADIIELNTVRKCLSSVKGGKLSLMSYPASVVTLMLSDIIGNRPEFIASGPTFENDDDSSKALDIIKKYSLETSLPQSIKQVLNNTTVEKYPPDIDVSNYVIGNNTMAIQAGNDEASNLGYHTLVLSDSIHGDVETLSYQYCRLVCTIIFLLLDSINTDVAEKTLKTLNQISLCDDDIQKIKALKLNPDSKGVFLIAGGEPTVSVKGTGKGGRSQELALRFSSNFNFEKKQMSLLNNYDVHMLCAGTDGIDGPTDAAGAIGYSHLISDALDQNLCAETYLANNDTYNFYRKFCNEKFHVKTGHTNTNVMDIHMIIITPKKLTRVSVS
ncbi:glycerate kinase [Arctopsyche grandis]|uniref:glycerate kinase n=1 Tax=Arctopsyche grandis TaxID=121162 RepID=UPI00406D9485